MQHNTTLFTSPECVSFVAVTKNPKLAYKYKHLFLQSWSYSLALALFALLGQVSS